MRKKLKPWQKETIQIVVVVVVAFGFYQGLAIALQTPLPILSVVSDSMDPTLQIGDLIIAGKADYQVGDIAIYDLRGITIVHRITEKRGDSFIFKGDNNPVADPETVPVERIRGKVHLAVPLLGYPRLFLHWVGI